MVATATFTDSLIPTKLTPLLVVAVIIFVKTPIGMVADRVEKVASVTERTFLGESLGEISPLVGKPSVRIKSEIEPRINLSGSASNPCEWIVGLNATRGASATLNSHEPIVVKHLGLEEAHDFTDRPPL